MNPANQPDRLFSARVVPSLLAAVLMLFISTAINALPTDRDQPIQLSSDSAEIDDKKGISVYIGQVHIKQGSLEINADKVTVYSDDQGVKQMVAVGRPARLQQRPDKGKPLTKGFGKTVEYHLDIDRAIFIGSAELRQGADTFKGDRIQFDIKKDIVTAHSAGKQKGSQVQMFIPPRNKNKQPD